MIKNEWLDFICLQEAKKENVNFFFCQSIWGGPEVGWCFKESVGSSGGLLCMWDPKVFVIHQSFTGTGFLGVQGTWGTDLFPAILLRSIPLAPSLGRGLFGRN